MATLAQARSFVSDHHHGVLAVTRADGGSHLSPVVAALDAGGDLLLSTRASAVKVALLRATPRASLCVLSDGFFGPWVQVEGPVTIVELPAAMDGLVDYYRTISGEHPDWAAYRQAMQDESRVLLRLAPERVVAAALPAG